MKCSRCKKENKNTEFRYCPDCRVKHRAYRKKNYFIHKKRDLKNLIKSALFVEVKEDKNYMLLLDNPRQEEIEDTLKAIKKARLNCIKLIAPRGIKLVDLKPYLKKLQLNNKGLKRGIGIK